ncbi:hypothetical protein FQA39_LY07507 [Lamprigera yunnana]|nr:hypothetical protein FQA39_LY07507 [Lamprigera yunnana]
MTIINSTDTNNLQLANIFMLVSETELNNKITSAQDVSLLRSLLEIKAQFVADKKQSKIDYSIDFILSNSLVIIDELCQVIHLALLVQTNTNEYLKLLHLIRDNLLSDIDTIKYLKLLNVTLTLCKFDEEQDIFNNFVDHYNFEMILNTLINGESKVINNYLSVNIFPKYLPLNNESSKILVNLIYKFSFGLKNFDILCAAPEFFINNVTVLKKSFWSFLQAGLNNNSSTVQKQALYLLKISINLIRNKDCFSSEEGVVYWAQSCKENVLLTWHNLFILYEVIREKQLHLIEPIYNLVPTIKTMHPSWLFSIYGILLFHSQNSVCTYTILDLLKSDWYFELNLFKEVIECIVRAINKTEIVLNFEIWENLFKFTQKVDEERFKILLEKSCDVSWVPSACYKFYNAILRNKIILIPFQVLEKIISNLRKVPHKLIRDQCLSMLTLLQDVYLENASFDDCLQAHKVFYQNKFYLWRFKYFKKFELNLQSIVKTWTNNQTTDIEDVEIILNIIKQLEIGSLQNFVVESFHRNLFTPAILDRIYVLFNEKLHLSYLTDRLSYIQSNDDAYLKHVGPLLTKSNQIQIWPTLLNILLCDCSNRIQVEICFGILNSSFSGVTSSITLDTILEKWLKHFLNGTSCNANISISFLQLYCKEKCNDSIMPDEILNISEIFENVLDTQDSSLIPEIFSHLQYLIIFCDKVEMLFPFIDICVQKLHELKGTRLFKIAVFNFVKSLLLNDKIFTCDKIMLQKCVSVLYWLTEWMSLYEDVGYTLSKNLCAMLRLCPNVGTEFIPIIIELLLFGDILKKDQRAEYEVCQLIPHNNEEDMGKNPNLRRVSIRGEMIKCIENILHNNINGTTGKTGDVMCTLLLENYSKLFNKRCFSDSHVHLVKLRILQGLLLIHEYVGTEKEALIDTLLESICTESHQLSNKFLIVWLLIRLLFHKEDCLEIISAKITLTNKPHSSTICAFVSVLYHIALLRNENRFYEKVIRRMLPWTMGPHFNLRLHAQTGIKKVYEHINEKNQHIHIKFREVVKGVTEVLEQTDRDIEIIDKYIFENFDPIADFNLETIYYIIPHITNVINHEYENIRAILKCNIHNKHDYDQFRTKNQKCFKEVSNNFSSSAIQKKIIPQDIVDRKIGDLIVVGSLIDKVPNLGGLSRTCEIFGVKELTLSSNGITKNPDFQNLSMSSENWINIIELKRDDIPTFLLNMKAKGYSIVGAEQTSESIRLNKFTFPKKCILLLGNEKEGIPPNLLSLVDTCVEIPQLGVIRSLNVHVAGATLIWEYTKTHLTF